MVSAVLWVAATKAVAQAITWAITIVVVGLLSPKDYGLMGMAILFMGFLLLFNEFGLGAALVREPALDTTDVAALTWTIFATNAVLFVLVELLAPLVARYFHEPALTAIVRVLGTSFILNGVGAPSAYMLTRAMEFRRKSQAELVGSVAGAVSTLACAVAGIGVWSLVAGYMLQQAATNALYCMYHAPALRRAISLSHVRRFINFGLQVAVAKLLWYFSSNADFLVVGRVLGTVPLGYYALAFQFSSVPIDKIVAIVTQVAFPAFSSLQSTPETLQRYYLRLVGLVALLTFPMFLGLFLVADAAVPAVLGTKWVPAILPLKILCIVACSRAIETLNAPLLTAKGRPRVMVFNNLLQSIVLPIAFYIGTRSGLTGVSIAWLIAWPLLAAVVTYQTLRLAGVGWASYARALTHPIAGSVAMVAGVIAVQRSLLTDVSAAYSVAVSAAVGCLVYLTYNLVFNPDAIRDAAQLLRRGDAQRTPRFDQQIAHTAVAAVEAD